MENTKTNQCPEFPHFGASYPDATCIDGYLWDLDHVNDDGTLYGGGDDPCPFCNKEEFVEWLGDEWSRIDAETYIENLEEKYNR
ncbi:hypothetical protein [Chryseobacterium vrystaatense]|uniref:Uncharacterized protein n=1 Tax=Chryseobacterium vrystaatense TaxID=307480 RepID=A0A1M4ZMC3_9FLAO|nr:hypothetical protein [Chryseobacterium vrystaatense]SHF19193.1 hypothetical protein SAMN02787073_1643 [Chryseobacterium vrystaatense]